MTIKELAKLAGVSPATVSLALNGKKGVGEEKRQEILRLANENQYSYGKKTSSRIRNILFIKYSRLGLIFEENMTFITTVMDAAEKECQRLGYNLIVMNWVGNLQEAFKTIDYKAFFGVLILGTEISVEDYPSLDLLPLPYIVIDNRMPHYYCNCVAIDNWENAYRAVSHFLELGFTDIGYVQGEQVIQNFKEREDGYRSALLEQGLIVNPENIFTVPPTTLGAYETTRKRLEAKIRIPECLFVDNDTMAIGIVKALTEAGLRIPEDVSIIGFDDIPFSEILSPALTTIRVDKRLLGTIAISLLVKTVEEENYKTVKVSIAGELILRQTTRTT